MLKRPFLKASLLISLLCFGPLRAQADDVAHGNERQTGDGVLKTIPALDVPRYMGVWFEIAKFPNWFQHRCSGATSAQYSLKNDGRVQVINRCRTQDGEMIEAVGVARQVGSATSPQLQVRFAPEWLSFLPLVWGDYWVIDLDERYHMVAVSEPKRQYLWILARTPHVDPHDYKSLLTRLSKMGFDLSRLEVTRQD